MRALILLISIVGLLSACNTMQGIGKDVKAGGEAIERAAKK
jgi:predicted small secreted protein